MPQEPIKYTVSMARANAHYFDVTVEFPIPEAERGDDLRLRMPVWTPGHYVVDDYARNISAVRAYDATSGRELPVEKIEKSLWVVGSRGSARVRVEYPVYAFLYTVGSSYVDALHALINGASVYLYAERMKGSPAKVVLKPPPDWKVVATGLMKTSEWEYEAPDYDVLVDSPFEVGNQEIHAFQTGGAKYEVSIYGRAPVDHAKFVSDLQRVVESTTQVFGSVPYERYVFLVNFTDIMGGGLEHLNSTMCFLPRLRMMPHEEYDSSMGLFSHEFFHAWNVKRLRPAGLGPFDYTSEVYTKSLWIAEGLTSYYDDLILRRAGIYTVEEYLDALVGSINLMKSLPGSRVQSAEQSSFDTWTKYYRPDENSPNVTSSYYTQGTVIGWMVDMIIRRSSHGSKSLDDAMRRMYAEFYQKQNRGYTDEEFETTCTELGGPAIKEVFDSRVRAAADVDYGRYLGYAGLSLVRKDERASEKGYLGVKLKSEAGKTTVSTILAGSPAEAMGLSTGDEILGVDGFRMSQDRVSFTVETAQAGKQLRFTIARNGRLMEIGGPLGKRPAFEYRIQALAGAADDQKALFRGWMLSDWRAELKYPEYPKSPDRRPTFDYV